MFTPMLLVNQRTVNLDQLFVGKQVMSLRPWNLVELAELTS